MKIISKILHRQRKSSCSHFSVLVCELGYSLLDKDDNVLGGNHAFGSYIEAVNFAKDYTTARTITVETIYL